ncbi:RNA polymerase II-binding domain protein [Colletotrichum tofieldiae]|nr:RNA polymerase II-binding domain protein [Colletotrichum tofieldiae]
MNPDMIKPLQLAPGPADKALANAVKDLLVDVERLYSKTAPPQTADSQQHMDVSEMGERIVLDEVTGEIVHGETYYGWSRRFCEKMKQRRKKAKGGNDGPGRGRSDSRSRSRSRSRSYSPAAQALTRFAESQSQPQPFSTTESATRSIEVEVRLSSTLQIEIKIARSRPKKRQGLHKQFTPARPRPT